MQVSDVITRAAEDLGLIAPGETLPTTIQADFFNRLNDLVDSLSAEGLVVPNQVVQAFALQTNVSGYTLGSGGSFATSGALRAVKVTAWRAFYSNLLQSGGRVLSMTEFGEHAKTSLGVQSAIPDIVAADTAYPLINVRVSPPPSASPGQLELSYWTPIAAFVTVNDVITLPSGWPLLLRCVLAGDLFGQYGKPSLAQYIASRQKDAKAAIIEQNAMAAPQPQPANPQGQQ